MAKMRNQYTSIEDQPMALEFIDRCPGWTTIPINIDNVDNSRTNPVIRGDKTLETIFGVHTIEFGDHSRANIFDEITCQFNQINNAIGALAAGDLPDLKNEIKLLGQPLVTINEYLVTTADGKFFKDFEVISLLHSKTILGVGFDMSPIISETFRIKNTQGLSYDTLFGLNINKHIKEKSVYVTYNQFISGEDGRYTAHVTNQNSGPYRYGW
jgi:hypothetical protein